MVICRKIYKLSEYEESMEKENLESKTEANKPIRIVYRENDLFPNYVSEIKNYLESKGRKVDVTSFPEGTEEENIKKWFKGNVSSLEKEILLTDYTCNFPYMNRGELPPANEELKKIRYSSEILDEIIEKSHLASLIQLSGAEGFKFLKSMENLGKFKVGLNDYKGVYESLFKTILNSSKKEPEKIYLIQKYLNSHFYPDELQGKFSKRSEEEKFISSLFEEYLIGAGIPKEKIKTLENLDYSQINNIDKPDNWIVIDRHNDNKDHIKNANLLMLPFEHLIEKIDIHKKDMTDEVVKHIKTFVDEMFN